MMFSRKLSTELEGKQLNVPNSKGYYLENKFELLEDFQTYKPTLANSQEDTEMATFSMVVEGSSSAHEVPQEITTIVPQSSNTKWGPKEYKTSTHPLKLMV